MYFVIIFVIFLVFFPLSSVEAYLDPGIGGMFVQLLATGLAGILIILKIFWKKISSSIKRKKDNQKQKNLEEDETTI